MGKYKLRTSPNRNEPYWARFVPSWRNPPKYIPPIRTTKPLQHCKACTWSCNYAGYTEYEKSYMCPYYNLQ